MSEAAHTRRAGRRPATGSGALTDRDGLLQRLREAGAKDDADIDLAETALVLAALDRPGTGLDGYRRHLAALAEETGAAARDAAGPSECIDALREVIFGRHGYAGDTDSYDDMRNANLMSVIDRRRGLPVALGILCIHAARSRGWDMAGINFPSHFLLRLRGPREAAVIDPFDAARVLDGPALRRRLKAMHGAQAKLAPGHCRPVGNRDVLLRLQNNIRIRALRDGHAERALDVMESMILLAPRRGDLRLESAAIQARSGKLRAAIGGLEAFLDLGGEAEGRGAVAQLLQELKGKLN